MAKETAADTAQSEVIEALIARVEAGRAYAAPATEFIIGCGLLAVGTAMSTPEHVPDFPWTARDAAGNHNGWQVQRTSERGTQKVIVATNVPRLAIFTAIGGDRNVPGQRQRIGRSLMRPDLLYDRGTHGATFNPATRQYDLEAHIDLLNALRDRHNLKQDCNIIGAIDFVEPGDPSEVLDMPDEPGNFAITALRKTKYSLPVRATDRETLGSIKPFSYAPILLDA